MWTPYRRGPACAGRASAKAEPGADAGPAAPQAPPWSKYGRFRQRITTGRGNSDGQLVCWLGSTAVAAAKHAPLWPTRCGHEAG